MMIMEAKEVALVCGKAHLRTLAIKTSNKRFAI